MVCEFITSSFVVLCLFIVLIVQCWSDKHHIICLVSNRFYVLVISCLCSLVLMLNILRYGLFVVLVFAVFPISQSKLIIVDGIEENRIHVYLF
jgi:hypothetical protein